MQSDYSVSDLSELSFHNQQLTEKMAMLQAQIVEYERKIESYEMQKSDWSDNKVAMVTELATLKQELQEKEEALAVVEAEKVRLRSDWL